MRSYSVAHPYHLVDVSPWPILMSVCLLFLGLLVCSWLTHKLTNIYYPLLCLVSIV